MTGPLHVAIAGWRLGAEHSGANRRLLEVVQHAVPLLQPGEQITVLHRPALQLEGLLGEALAAVNRCPIVMPPGPAWRRAQMEQQRLPKLLKELGATLFETGYRPAPRNLPCPFTLTVHDLRDLHGWRNLPKKPARWLLRRTLMRAAGLAVPSEFTRAETVRLCDGQPPPVRVIPNGVDPLFGYRAWTSNHGREFVLHVGHLEARKNLETLIRGFASWQRRSGVHKMDLLLVGGDHGRKTRLRKLSESEGVQGQVHFAGNVAEAELRDLYLRAAAIAVPSAYEGFGLCALEGLAAGSPVLVSDQGALPEVVGPAGLVLPHDDPEAWADGLAEAMELRGPRDIARRRGRAAEFSWQRAAAAQLQLWREASRTGDQPLASSIAR